MKQITLLLFVFTTCMVSAQTPQTKGPSEDLIYNSAGIDQKPEFPGGMDAFYRYLASNLKVVDNNAGGKILASFIVEKDGSLGDIKIVRDIGAGSAAETIRVLKESPKWNPGKMNGKEVRCAFMLPITIRSNAVKPLESKPHVSEILDKK
ncbi:MAG: hypothetical protein EOO50_07255 [Flavobacterium sp.]|uniref:energy transducer TonB n=1 Tax=Flavobacterium sp. TaxID=239 RepID=UPI00121DFB61|nr:energy transducer TonB [Flavobacterium sp.]RZJ67053.1 MAG: hypothetical protein EOO50_07255 [Flavobacterium sp.]